MTPEEDKRRLEDDEKFVEMVNRKEAYLLKLLRDMAAENKRLKDALVDAWVEYDVIPAQLATQHHDDMARGDVSPYDPKTDEYERERYSVWQLSPLDVELIARGEFIN